MSEELSLEEVSLEEVTALILQAHTDRGGERLPPTAFNKIVHFVEKGLESRGIDTDIRQFWYMYGKVTAKSDTDVYEQEMSGKTGIQVDQTTDQISASPEAIRHGQKAVDRGVQLYYDLGLDGLITKSYEDAPYDAQRAYLDLKATLEATADTEQTTLGDYGTQDQTKGRIRDHIYEFIEQFPTGDFSELERDLHTWYRLFSAELDSDDYDSEYGFKLTKQFWRLFSLEIASRENDDLTNEEIARELNNVDSITAEQARIRDWFSTRERAKTRKNARTDRLAQKAATAVALPKVELEFGV